MDQKKSEWLEFRKLEISLSLLFSVCSDVCRHLLGSKLLTSSSSLTGWHFPERATTCEKNEITCFNYYFSRNEFQFCSKPDNSWQFICDTLIKSILSVKWCQYFQEKSYRFFFSLYDKCSQNTIIEKTLHFSSLSPSQQKTKMALLCFYSRERIQKSHTFLRNLPMRCVQNYVLLLLQECWLADQGHFHNGVQAA